MSSWLGDDGSAWGASAPACSLILGGISVERLDVEWVPWSYGLWCEWILETKLRQVWSELVTRGLVEWGSIRSVAHWVNKSRLLLLRSRGRWLRSNRILLHETAGLCLRLLL